MNNFVNNSCLLFYFIMALGDYFRELAEKIRNSANEKQVSAVTYLNKLSDHTKDSIYSYNQSNKAAVFNFGLSVRKYSNETFESVLEKVYLYDLVEYRLQLLSQISISTRIFAVFLPNLPLLIFSKASNKIRNPVVFTTIAAVLIVPELVNPFNRS